MSNHAGSGDGDAFQDRLALHGKLLGELVDGQHVGQVALVELQHVGDGIEIEIVIFQVLAQVIERFEVGVNSSCESATNTTPSAPFRIRRRLAS